MKLHYRNTREDNVAHYYALNPGAIKDGAYYHYSYLVIWWLLLVLGIYVGFEAEMLLASCIFAVGLFYSVTQNIPYRRVFHQSIEQAVVQEQKEICLEVREEGLTETIDGVKSFAPWESVRGYQQLDRRLFVELASGSWAIIPEREIREGAQAFERLIAKFAERGIRNMTEQDGGSERE